MEKSQLTDADLDEVSMVDRGGNQFAKIVILKRDEPVTKCAMGRSDVSKCEFMKGGVCANKNCAAKMPTEMEKAAPAGIQFNIGFKSDGGGSDVQSVVFDSEKWDESRAKAWLKEHDMASGKMDKTSNTLRFRQKDPEGYSRFRMITPGAQVSKALKAKDSWSNVQRVVDAALREKFQEQGSNMASPVSYVFVRDLWDDSAIFEQDGKVYRADYELDYDANGDPTVTFGNKIPQQVVYQDVVTKTQPPPEPKPPEIPAELLFKLGRLSAQASLLSHRVGRLSSRK